MKDQGNEALAVSVREAAAMAGIGGTLMYQLLREGKGPPSLTIRSRRLIRVQALREWLADLESKGDTGSTEKLRSGAINAIRSRWEER